MRWKAIGAGVVGAVVVWAIISGIFRAGKEGAPGFFGPGVLIADVNLILEILLILGLTWGRSLARRGSIEAHRVNQTFWVLVNATLVWFMMMGSLADVKLESARDLWSLKYFITWLHAAIGTLTIIAGLWLVLQMNDILPKAVHVSWWKPLMRTTFAGFWVTAILGFVVYVLWYVAGG